MRLQTARKVHECTECGKAIPRGTRYWYSEGNPDTGFYSKKEHTNCERNPPWPTMDQARKDDAAA